VIQIEKELSEANHFAGQRPLAFNDWSLDFLADHIVTTHDAYVKKSLPELRRYASKVAQVHGDAHPELVNIEGLIEDLDEELSHHMIKEENILFPYIKDLVLAEKGHPLRKSHFGTVQNPITMMELEHDAAGEILEKIRLFSFQYTIPQDACASYTLLYKMLEEFESDLHIHIHLENNILFPKAIKLEQTLEGK